MARPLKKGLGYFPLDTDLYSDRKIQRLLRKYGCKGICIYLAILCEIYREKGDYISYDSDFCFDISVILGLDEATVSEAVLYCIDLQLFDRELLEYRQVLSSLAIQRRFREISKRLGIKIDPDLEIPDNWANEGVIVAETPVIATETPVSVTKTPENGNGNQNVNVNQSTQYGKSNETRFSDDNGEAARREELLRMAEEATRCC